MSGVLFVALSNRWQHPKSADNYALFCSWRNTFESRGVTTVSSHNLNSWNRTPLFFYACTGKLRPVIVVFSPQPSDEVSNRIPPTSRLFVQTIPHMNCKDRRQNATHSNIGSTRTLYWNHAPRTHIWTRSPWVSSPRRAKVSEARLYEPPRPGACEPHVGLAAFGEKQQSNYSALRIHGTRQKDLRFARSYSNGCWANT